MCRTRAGVAARRYCCVAGFCNEGGANTGGKASVSGRRERELWLRLAVVQPPGLAAVLRDMDATVVDGGVEHGAAGKHRLRRAGQAALLLPGCAAIPAAVDSAGRRRSPYIVRR